VAPNENEMKSKKCRVAARFASPRRVNCTSNSLNSLGFNARQLNLQGIKMPEKAKRLRMQFCSCRFFLTTLFAFVLPTMCMGQEFQPQRAKAWGIDVGILPAGQFNAITDVSGVKVGHATIVVGDSVRTGVTAIVPHAKDIYQEKVPAAVYAGNAFGKLAGSTQVRELGNIETPIVLTNTLSVPACVQALVKFTLEQSGNEQVRSVNAIVGETNDGYLNDIRGMHVDQSHVLAALRTASSGIIEEGNVGAGTGTVCFGFKGGIGSSSRVLPKELGGYMVGVLVQTNFGGILTINGAPVGRELGQFAFSELSNTDSDGSCMIVIATDAPLSPRNLERLAKRSLFGMARTGAMMSNGSGDYAIAFSTAYRVSAKNETPTDLSLLSNDRMSPLFQAVAEATEESIYNSLFMATTVRGRDGHGVKAIPAERTIKIMRQYNLLNLNQRLPSIKRK